MTRHFPLLGFAVLSFVSFLPAQESVVPDAPPLKATPELTELIGQIEQTISKMEKPDDRAPMLFQLLTFQLRFEDRGPVRETIQTVMKLVPEFEQEIAKIHLLEAVAVAQVTIGDYAEAEKTLALIPRVSERAETRLNIAEGISNLNETKKPEKPHDVSNLLREAADGAAEAKDPGLEALASALLGRELGRQGKLDDAKAAFDRARLKSRDLEEIEQRNTVALIVQSQISCGMTSEALATIATVPSEETKQALFGFAALTLAREGKADEAEKMLQRVKQTDALDNALIGMAKESIQTISLDKLRATADRMSSPERKNLFFENVMQGLMEADRFDVATELAKSLDNQEEWTAPVRLGRIEKLIGDKKFDDAEKAIAALENPQWKQAATRHLALARIKDGDVETARKHAEATLSAEEKSRIALLTQERAQIAEIENPDERIPLYFDLLESQFSLFDLNGSKHTLDAILKDVEKTTDPVKKIYYYMALSRIQSELGDKSGAKGSLSRLTQFLAEINDLMTLKNLVPEDRPGPDDDEGDSPQPVVRLARTVDEAAVKDQLFEIYVTIGSGQKDAGDADAAKKSFAKARELADAETDVRKKYEKLYVLLRIAAEGAAKP